MNIIFPSLVLAHTLSITYPQKQPCEYSVCVNANGNNEVNEYIEEQNDLLIKAKIDEEKHKISLLDKSNKKQWFINYKKIQNEYAEWCDQDETIYDVYNRNELALLFGIVEAEVSGENRFQSKVNVASVIYNRLKSKEFPNTLYSVLTQRSQFSSYSNGRYRNKPTEETKLACEYAYQIHNSVGDCLYFDSCKVDSWARNNKEYVFTDSVGHVFYR